MFGKWNSFDLLYIPPFTQTFCNLELFSLYHLFSINMCGFCFDSWADIEMLDFYQTFWQDFSQNKLFFVFINLR